MKPDGVGNVDYDLITNSNIWIYGITVVYIEQNNLRVECKVNKVRYKSICYSIILSI